MLLLALAACSNLDERTWYPEGGDRHMTGEYGDPDTGSEDDSGDTGADADAPTITDVTASYTAEDAAGDVYIDVLVAFTDPSVEGDETGDVAGGSVNFTFDDGTGESVEQDLTIVDGGEYTTATQAGLVDGTVEFQLGPVDATKTQSLTEVYLQDAGGNESNHLDYGDISAR